MKNISQHLIMEAVSISQAATAYSNSVEFRRSTGDTCVWVKSTAGSVTITQECSFDNVSWFAAVDSAASALGAVATTMTVTTGKWIKVSAVLCPYIRFKVVEQNSAATVVTMRLFFGEELK